MTQKIGVVVLPLQTVLGIGIRSRAGLFSPFGSAIVPAKTVAPLPPTIEAAVGVSNAPGTIRLILSLPTTNTDGSPLAAAELIRVRVHFATSPGVSEAAPFNDFPASTHLTWAPGLSGRVYMRAKVQDSHGNWSALSNEVYADVPEVKEFDFWAHRIGVESIFTNNSPSAGYVSWSNVKIYFKNQGWTVQNGSTNKRYIYWLRSSPTYFQTSDTVPALGIEDVLIGTNINGVWHLAIYHPQVSAEFIRTGLLQSRNWGSSTGSLFDLDTGVFKLGGSANPKLSWDGSTLSVIGNITVTGGSVPYSYVTGGPPANADNTATVIGAGLITTGRIELGSGGYVKAGIDGSGTSDSDIRFWAGADYANRGTAPFRVTQGGALVATSATITGGYLGGTTAITIDSSGINVGTTGSIRGGKTGYGSGTGFFLGYSGGTYKFDIGSSSQYLRWDGSTLYVKGRIVTDSGSSISGSYLVDSSVTDSKIVSLSASKITAGTITASTIRTSSTYPMAVMWAEGQKAHHIEVFGSDNKYSFLGPGFMGVGLPGYPHGVYIMVDSAGRGLIYIYGANAKVEPYTAGEGYIGSSAYYWYEVNAKYFTDRGCLAWFDDGVEMLDGRVLSDVEALKAIRPSNKMTEYGKPMLDYSTLPKAVYREGKPVERDGKIVEGTEGAELTALISIMIGAIKELDARLEKLEKKIN